MKTTIKWLLVIAAWALVLAVTLNAYSGRYQRLTPSNREPAKFDTWTGETYTLETDGNWSRVREDSVE